MCGRYVSPADWAIEHFWHIGARNSGRWIQSFNVAPTMQVPMLCLTPQGELELMAARWGLIPFLWTQPKPPDFSFNARSEGAATMPMWRQSLRTHRCLMPALGWYEWNKKPAGPRQIRPQDNSALLPPRHQQWRTGDCWPLVDLV